MSILKNIQKYNNIKPEDIENIKLSLMASHPFIFLRGTDEIFFELISQDKFANHDIFDNELLTCWSSNDSHIGNFGFSNIGCSTNSEVHYEINDYDEAFIGNPFYDILRLASSLYYFLEEFNIKIEQEHPDEFINLKPSEFILLFVTEYKNTIKDENFNIDWDEYPFMSKMKRKSEKRANNDDSSSRFSKYTTINKKGKIKLDTDSDKLEKLEKPFKKELIESLEDNFYPHKVLDVARRKTAGVGSSHLDRYYFILEKKEGPILMEIKEQVLPVHLNYMEKYKDLHKKEQKKKNFGHIHHEAIIKMVGKDYDENMRNFNFRGKNFIGRTSFNAKLKVSADNMFSKDMNTTELKSNLREYIKLAANRLASAHFNSVQNGIENKQEAQQAFKQELLFQCEVNMDTVLGMVKSVYNHIDIKYSQFLREYYMNIGQLLGEKKVEEIKKTTIEKSENKSSSSDNKSSISTGFTRK